MAPSLAILVGSFLEETKLYPQTEGSLGVLASITLKENYKRFLDDCFLYWPIRLESINVLADCLN